MRLQKMRLVMVPGPPRPMRDFLQTDQIGPLVVDDFQNSFEPIPPIMAADPLVDVVTEKSQTRGRGGWRVEGGELDR